MADNIDDAGMAGAYDNEHWGNPTKSERYDRVGNRRLFRQNLEDANIGKDVDPSKARKFHKVYKDAAVLQKEEADRKYREGLAILKQGK